MSRFKFFFFTHYFLLDTFDVIIPNENEILLVDFGPLNAKAKLHAFKWSEIQPIIQKVNCFFLTLGDIVFNCFLLQSSSEDVVPVFRYLESDVGILTPSLCKTLKIE